jgi:uncharacterized delta-60 repeat protein
VDIGADEYYGAPEIAVEQPAASGLTDGVSSLTFGTVGVGSSSALKTFTIRNMGNDLLSNLAVAVSGSHASDFTVDSSSMGTALDPGGSTTFTVTFSPSQVGNRSATLQIASNDSDETPFDIALSSAATGTLTAGFATSGDVPLTTNGLIATGSTVNLTLNFVPAPGSVLTLVNNTSASPISGTFSNLAQGQAVALSYGGSTYNFFADYFGGDGNDLVLVQQRPGVLDYSFNASGKVKTAIGSGNEQAWDVAVQPDGRIVAVGWSNNGSIDAFAVVRYNADGSLDGTFGTGGKVLTTLGNQSNQAFGVVLQPDGKIIVAGLSMNDGVQQVAVVRYNANGSLDTSFDGDGKVVTPLGSTCEGRDVVLQSDGKIVVGGDYWSGTDTDFILLRYNSNGNLDTSFGTGGVVTTAQAGRHDEAACVALAPGGKIVLGGYYQLNTARVLLLARYNTDGTLDTSFSVDGIVTTQIGASDFGRAVAVQTDGKILLAGQTPGGGGSDAVVVRYNTDGALDTSFDGDGIVGLAYGTYGDYAYSVVQQWDGKILVAGNTEDGVAENFMLARLNPDGSLDTGFASTGKVSTSFGATSSDQAFGMALQPDGKMVLVGRSSESGNADFAVVRYLGDTSHDVTFTSANDVPLNANGFTATGQKVNITLGFAPVIGTELLLVNNTGTNPISGTVTGIANGATVPLTYNSITYNFIANYMGGTGNDLTLLLPGPGGLDYTFNGSGKAYTAVVSGHYNMANAVAVQADGKVVVGGISTHGTPPDGFTLARYLADGTLDPGFGTGGKVVTELSAFDDGILDLALQADGKIIAVGYAGSGGGNQFVVARYTAGGALDTSFNGTGKVFMDYSGGNDEAYSVAVQSDGMIVVVGSGNADSTCVVLRYTTTGLLDTSFNGTGYVSTTFGMSAGVGRCMAIQAGGKILAGGFASNGGQSDFAVARFNTNGTLDTSFNGSGCATTDIGGAYADRAYGMAAMTDGRIVLVGQTVPGAFADFAMVCHNANGSLDATFNGGGKFTTRLEAGNDGGSNAVITSDGKIVVVGNDGSQGMLLRFNSNGSYDSTWGNNGVLTTRFNTNLDHQLSDLALQPDGRIVVAGFRENGADLDFVVARFLMETVHAVTFATAESAAPLNADGFMATGHTANITLGFAPTTGTELLLVNNTGTNPITGTFTNIANGATIPLTYNSVTYNFIANYTGGTGNDLTLLLPGPGALDYSFNASAKVLTPIGNGSDTASKSLIQPDGKVLVVGTSVNGSTNDICLARYNGDGTLDSSFNGTGKVTIDFATSDDFGRDLALQSDGKIVVTGSYVVGGLASIAVARFNRNGTLDSSFNGTGKVITSIAGYQDDGNGVIVQRDGKIIVVGGSYLNPQNRFALVRYNTDGTLDASFNGTGIVTTSVGSRDDVAYCVVLQSDDKIVVAGDSNNGINGDFAVVRYNTNGSLDTSFNSTGMVTTPIGTLDTCRSMILQRDGKIVTAGWMFNGSTYDFALVRYNTNGTLDASFDGDGKAVTLIGSFDARCYGVALQSDGKLVAGGFASISGSTDFAVARYNSNGSLDTTFHGSGTVTTAIGTGSDLGYGIALQTDGRIVLVGAAANAGNDDFAVVRYLADATLNASFNSAVDVPLGFSGLNATGQTLNVSLNFTPSAGTSLKVFDNTGLQPISGEFTNLAQGQTVTLNYAGTDYTFVANYFGGDGNDLVLQWANTKLVAFGLNDSGQLGIMGTATQANVPTQVVAAAPIYQKTILATSSGLGHSLAVCNDGMMAAWGSNLNGQLGNGSNTNATTVTAVNMSGVLSGKKVIAVAAGWQHSLALCSDGTLVAWGDGSFGQLGNNSTLDSTVPVLVNTAGALSGKRVIAIGAGYTHSAALCSDGTVVCWGDNTNGELGNGSNTRSLIPVAVTTSGVLAGRAVTAIACGQNHTLALLADGTLASWGSNSNQQLGNFSGVSKNVPVAVNTTSALLGKKVAAISAGGNQNLVLCTDGSLAAWGEDDHGQIGSVSVFPNYGTPQPVVQNGLLAGKTISRVGFGAKHAFVVCSDGSMAAWGLNSSGQLGLGDTTDRVLPVTVMNSILGQNDSFIAAASGANANCTLAVIGTTTATPMIQVEQNGLPLVDNAASGPNFGGLVVGSTQSMTFTVRNTGTQNLSAISASLTGAGQSHYAITQTPSATLAPGAATTVTLAFTPTAYGGKPVILRISSNVSGALNPFDLNISGTGNPELYATWLNAVDVPAVASSFDASSKEVIFTLGFAPATGATLMVLNNTGTTFIDGYFDSSVYGQLVQGQDVELDYNGTTYTFIADYYGGDGNDLVLRWAGTRLLAWGAGTSGQLGNSASSNSSLPVVVNMSTGALVGKRILNVTCGANHSVALCADGTLAAWGSNASGQLGNNNATGNSNVPVAVLDPNNALLGRVVVSIAAGADFTLALCNDGKVAAWGRNIEGQLGNNNIGVNSPVPVLLYSNGLPGGKMATAIAAGGTHALVRCSDGTLFAWGTNSSGQLGKGDTATSAVPVAVDMSGVLFGKKVALLAAGYSHCHVVCTDGTQAAWGDDGFGALGDNSTTSSSVPVLVDVTGALAGHVTAQMGAGQYHSAWLAKDGMLVAWGRNNNAQLGIATSTAYSAAPFAVPMTGAMAGKTVASLAVGRQHHVVQLTDGTLAAWGLAGSGQLGNGATTPSPTVTPVAVNLSAMTAGEKILRVSSGTGALHNISMVAQPLSQPGGPPVITTNAATTVDKTIATLNGLVSPNSLATTAYFEYGLTTSYGTQTIVQNLGGGSSSVAVAQALTGLQANTTYHYRISATNSGGTAVGNDLTFTTLPDPPLSVTSSANTITNTSATLAGTVNPNNRSTSVYFQFGTDTLYGNSTSPQNIAAGSSNVNVIAPISGLAFNTTYHYRMVAQNAGGTAYGSDVTFTTTAISAPTLGGLSASNATTNSVLLNGFVNPNGATTLYYFEFGLTTSSNFERITDTGGLSAGTSAVNVSLPGVQLTPGMQYRYRLVAENVSGITRSGEATFTTLPLPPLVNTQAATALSTTSARLNGDVRAQNGSAAVTFEWGTDGVNFPNSLAGTPSPVTGDSVTAVSADLSNLQQFTTYSFRVKAISAGGTTTGGVLSFQPQIISGLTLQFPSAPSASTGAVTVTLHNGGGTMGWRFIGEQNWRISGATVGGMTTGDRDIEYRAVPGYVQPPQETVTVTAGQPVVQVDREYFVTPVSGSGGLTVNLKPDTITSGNGRAQWRLLGEDDTQWRDSGATTSSLAAGTYLIECKPVSGRTTPAIATVQVSAGTTSSPTITYYLADSQAGTPPAALAFSTVSGDSTKPYAYVGQIRSNAGLSSGFVVKARVVATAAHVVFDDGTLSAAQGLQWLFQRDAGTYEPKTIVPRGFYLFDGYAAQRAADNSPGSSSPQSQNLDVAAIYFNEDAGRGGFGGFLASDLTNNEFLLSNANKTLVGYPIDGIALADQGRMHATPIANVTFTNPYGRTFATTGIRSSGGTSGGPLCVQHSNGNYYAAAVYLGGTNQTVVRAIDSSVIDLFNRAEVSGGGGANNTGGGITHTSVSGIASSNPGAIQVIIEPAGARAASPAAGGWRLLGATSSYKASSSIQGNLSAGVYQLDLTTPTGYQAPTQPTVIITGGQQTTVTFTYFAALSAQETWRQSNFGISTNTGSAADSADPDGDGTNNFAEYTAGTNPNDRSDVFKVKTAQKSGGSFTLTTDGKSGRSYILERNLTPDFASWSTVATQGPLGADGSVTFTDSSSPAGRAFYRIRVTGP